MLLGGLVFTTRGVWILSEFGDPPRPRAPAQRRLKMPVPGPHCYSQMAGYSVQDTKYNIQVYRNIKIRRCKDTGSKHEKDTEYRNTPKASQPGGPSTRGPADLLLRD